MYESGYRRINWVKLFLIVIIIVLIMLLTIKCISMIKFSASNPDKHYDKQLNSINDVILDYYNKDNIPEKVGSSSKLTLNELKDKDIKIDIKAYRKDTCDLDESYAQATRLETEYQIKTRLYCTDSNGEVTYDDYINTYVDLTEGTTKKTEKKKTTEKTTKEKKTKETKKTTEKVTEKTTEKTTEKVTEPTTVKTTKKTTTTTRTTKRVETTTIKTNTTQATVKPSTNNEVTIGFNANGGTVSYTSKTITKGSTTELPVPVRTSYKFVGWYKNGVKYTSSTKFDDSIILVAEWSQN